MSDIAVHGVGTSHFGRAPGTDLVTLAWTAVSEALADAGPGPIDAVWVGTVFAPAGVAQRVLRAMGITHAAICYNTYARYVGADGKEVFIRPGTPAAAIQQVYQAVLPPHGREVWSMNRGANGYLQPGLKLLDISGIPAPEKPDDPSGGNQPAPELKPATDPLEGEE